MANWLHVESKLAICGQWMIAEAAARGKRFWLTTGQRTLEEQWFYWNRWVPYLQAVGCKTEAELRNPTNRQRAQAQANGGIVAAYPGSSNHGRIVNGVLKEATAIDIACNSGDEALRDELGTKAGLRRTVPGEGWHWELDPRTKSLPTFRAAASPPPAPLQNIAPAPVVQPQAPVSEDEEEMSALFYRWETTGHAVRVYPNGDVDALDTPHYGGIGSLPQERRQGFHEVIGVTPVDPKDEGKGYVLWDKKNAQGKNNRYQFDAGELSNILANKWPN